MHLSTLLSRRSDDRLAAPATRPSLSAIAARPWGRRGLGILAGATLAAGALAGPAAAAPNSSTPPDASGGYAFTTLDNSADPTFNQLLGINNSGLIAGYFGSGQPVNGKLHPNKGYLLARPYGQGNYQNENFPGSEQTQVTGLDNAGVTVGFWVDAKGDNFGFYRVHGHFHQADFPTADGASPQVDQLLGVNDSGEAVGFYTDKNAVNHGYTYDIRHHRYGTVHVSGDTNVTASAINNLGDIAGIATNSAGNTEAYLVRHGGQTIHLNVPGSSSTQAFGVNDGDEVVGDYTVGTGSGAQTDGFVWVPGLGFSTINDPNGVGATTVNGLNDRGQLVGFYTDSAGNVDGFLASPRF